jgi:parallel beta-helix repeat protein
MNVIRQRFHWSWVKGCLFLALLISLGAMQARAATYYVTTSGNNGWAGTSEGTAWRTVTYAATRAHAGDTVNIKAGNYGNEHVVVSYAGTSGSPITFQGYGGTVLIGTLPSPRTIPASTEIGFKMVSKNYITLRNLNFTWYYECIWVESSDHVTLDNIHIQSCGADGAKGDGIYIYYSDYATITDCTVIDCGGDNVFLNHSNYCTIDNLTTLGTLASAGSRLTMVCAPAAPAKSAAATITGPTLLQIGIMSPSASARIPVADQYQTLTVRGKNGPTEFRDSPAIVRHACARHRTRFTAWVLSRCTSPTACCCATAARSCCGPRASTPCSGSWSREATWPPRRNCSHTCGPTWP